MIDYSLSPMTVRQVLEKYWDGSLPVNPALIARAMHIGLYKSENLGALGQVSLEDGKYKIIIDPNQSKPRRRFTIAHEIGHVALGHLRPGDTMLRDGVDHFFAYVKDPREVAANKFAAQLLMPAELVKTAFHKMPDLSVERGAEIFGVSEAAMGYRLINLGLARG